MTSWRNSSHELFAGYAYFSLVGTQSSEFIAFDPRSDCRPDSCCVCQRSKRLNAFLPLPISIEHALAVASLPPLHKDPFDRIIIAQANVEGLTLITDDAIIPQYAVKVL